MKSKLGIVIGLGALLAATCVWGQDTVPDSGSSERPPRTTTDDTNIPVSTENDATTTSHITSKGNRSVLISEIIVTAEKREENLQDVPLSVQAFTDKQLKVMGVSGPTDMMRIIPGLVITEAIGFTTTYIRGLGTDAFVLGSPSVANYIDGIYDPSASTANKDFGPVERIEVLKGPQGTLFGESAIGGSINVITKPLSFDHPDASASVSYGRYETAQTQVSLAVPLLDTLAIGFGGYYNNAGNYVDGHVGTHGLPRNIEEGGRAKVRWKPFDAFELDLAASNVFSSGLGSSYVVNTQPSLLGKALGFQPQDPYGGMVTEAPPVSFQERIYSGKTVLNTDWLDIKLLGSKESTSSVQGVDYDGSPEPVAYLAVNPNINKIYTAELQLVSNDTSWNADRFKWIVGAYYFKSHGGYKDATVRVAATQLNGPATVLGIALPQGLEDTYAFLNSLPVPTGTVGFAGLLDAESVSAYTQETYDFTDWASLTLGGRYQTESKGVAESTAFVRTFDGSRITIPSQDYSCAMNNAYCSRNNTFSPKVNVSFHVLEDTLLYLNWQKATKSGTFNTINIYTKPAYIPPAHITAYEAGVKTTLLNGYVKFNAAVFYYDLKDLQTQFISLLSGGAITFQSAQGASVKGAEFDIVSQILPSWVDNLVLTASGTVLNSRYTKFTNASGYAPGTGLFTTGNDYTGNPIVRSPHLSGSVSLIDTIYIPIGSVELSTDYYYNSGFSFLAENQPGDRQSAYGLLGARATLGIDAWGVRLSAFGRNLTNEKYYYERLHDDFGILDAVAPKATYGLQLSWEFK